MCPTSTFFCPFVVPICGGEIIQSRRYSHTSSFSYANYASRLFNHFGGGRPFHNVQFWYPRSRGRRSLHTVQSVTFRNPLNIPRALFTNSSQKAFLSILSDVPSISRHTCRLVSGFFILILPCSCCPRPQSLMPLLHSGSFHSLSPSFRGSSFHLVSGPIFPDDVFPTPCHSCTVGHLPAGDGQSLLGFTTCLDPSLRLLAATRGQIPVPTPLPQSSDRHHCGFFLGDFLMLHYGMHHSRISLILHCICLRRFVAGGRLLAGFLETLSCG
jgi:hypothetical protein